MYVFKGLTWINVVNLITMHVLIIFRHVQVNKYGGCYDICYKHTVIFKICQNMIEKCTNKKKMMNIYFHLISYKYSRINAKYITIYSTQVILNFDAGSHAWWPITCFLLYLMTFTTYLFVTMPKLQKCLQIFYYSHIKLSESIFLRINV